MQASVSKFRGQLPSPKELEELQSKSPGLFNSGYFLLAAIAGAPAASSNAAGFTVNVTRGGNAAQIVVVSRYRSSARRTAALGDRLDLLARRFATRNHLQVAIGGPQGSRGADAVKGLFDCRSGGQDGSPGGQGGKGGTGGAGGIGGDGGELILEAVAASN